MKSTSIILGIFMSVFGVINALPLGFGGLGYPLGGQSYSVSHSVPHVGMGIGAGIPYGGASYSVSHSTPHVGYGLGLGYGLGYGLGLGLGGSSVQTVSHGVPSLGLGYGYGSGLGLGHVSTSVHSVPQTNVGFGYGLGLGLGLPGTGATVSSVSHSVPHFGLPSYGYGLGAPIQSAVGVPGFGYGYGLSTFPGLYSTGGLFPTAGLLNSGSLVGALVNKASSSSSSDSNTSASTTGNVATPINDVPTSVEANGDKASDVVDNSNTGSNSILGNTAYGSKYGYPSLYKYYKNATDGKKK